MKFYNTIKTRIISVNVISYMSNPAYWPANQSIFKKNSYQDAN